MDHIKSLVLLSSVLLMTACGGSGGETATTTSSTSTGSEATGSSGVQPVTTGSSAGVPPVSVARIGIADSSPNQTYNGVLGSMAVNEDNTRNLLQTAFAEGALGTVQGLSKPSDSQSSASALSTTDNLVDQVVDSLNQNNKSLPIIAASKIDIDQTLNCDSGSFRIFGQLENSGVGTVSMSLNNCQFSGVSLSGSGEFEIFEFDIANSLITRGAIRFDAVSASANSGPNFTLDGEESYVLDESGSQAEVSSIFNLVVAEEGGPIVWFEDFQERALINIFTNDVELTFSGRIHHSDLGYVDVSTPATIQSQLIGGEFAIPDPDGQLRFDGSNSSSVLFTTFTTGVTMEIDEDGDGVVDLSENLTYEEVGLF